MSVNMKRISVAQPQFSGREREYVLDCMDSGWISSAGKYVAAFEKAFAEFCGVRHAIATNNGTTALHLALVAMGLQPGDEVLVPAVTYIATANAVRYCGATPVLVDVSPGTMNIDPADIERRITPNTKGIIPVHMYGHPAEIGAILEIAHAHKIFVVEDAAEAHGAEYLGKRVGTFGNCGTFSFFGNKIVTTGEGGMVVTNDDKVAAQLRLYRGQGVAPDHRYWFLVVGYNYRMTNIQAAIGLAQLENIERALVERAQLARWYDDALADLADQIVIPAVAPSAKHVYWMYNIFLREGGAVERDSVMRSLDESGIETRPVFYPLHMLPPYRQSSSWPTADLWALRGINLPTHQHLTQEDVSRIASSLRRSLQAL